MSNRKALNHNTTKSNSDTATSEEIQNSIYKVNYIHRKYKFDGDVYTVGHFVVSDSTSHVP